MYPRPCSLSTVSACRGLAIRLLRVVLPGFLALGLPLSAGAEKIWMTLGDGLWSDGTNWSGHVPPDITSFIKITNDVSKTITVDSTTATTNLTVQKLTINAPPGATNTLLLSSLTLTNPLVLQTGLELQDGAAIRITNSALQTLLTNDHVNIDGSLTLDSGLIDFGDVTVTARVGRVTSGTFTINGGTVWAGALTVGGETNSSGFLNVNGGVLNIASLFSTGRNPGTTGTVAVAGGQINVTNDDTRIGDEGVGVMSVSNAALVLNNLQVGRDNPGSLSLLQGGTVQVALDTVVGRFAGVTGALTIAGGQLLCNTQKVYVGRGGNGQLLAPAGLLSAGSLLVAADTTNSIGAAGSLSLGGGTILLSSTFAVGSAGYSTGQVSITAGQLTVTNAASTGKILPASGTIVMAGGTVTTDQLVLTNASSQFLLNNGTLDTKQTTVANGLPFVVGDGVSPAVLNLRSGTHTFANGLVISPNATLRSCGTIIGSVINNGTIATNCGSTPVSMPIELQTATGRTNLISFSSVLGSVYTLQYKASLSDATWTDLPPSTNGTGSTIVLRDTPGSPAPSRYYRVKIQ